MVFEIVIYACLFLILVSAIEHYFKRSALPPVCWVLMAGLLYGAANTYGKLGLPQLKADPELVLFVILPVLIFDSSRKLHIRELLSVGWAAGILATVGVLANAFLIGVPLSWILGIPMADGLLFGAIMAATDPVAVTAIFENFSFPGKLRTLIEGESLLNDGTTIILFSMLSNIVLGGAAFSINNTVFDFIIAVCGAVFWGLAMGWLAMCVLRLWHELHDRFIGAVIPLAAVYLSFVVAEHFLHVSGVIAVMTASLTMASMKRRSKNEEKKDPQHINRFFDRFWDFLGSLANAVLFFILGAHIGGHPLSFSYLIIPLILVDLLAARSIVVYAVFGLLRLPGKGVPAKWQHVINVAGLKGALAIALILLLPADYEHRVTFLGAAFVLILFTLIGNSLFMQFYLGRTDLKAEE